MQTAMSTEIPSISAPRSPRTSRYRLPQSFGITRQAYNFTSLDAALMEVFDPVPPISFAGVEAVEFTVAATSIQTSGLKAVDNTPSDDTTATPTTVAEASNNLWDTDDKWFELVGGYLPETPTSPNYPTDYNVPRSPGLPIRSPSRIGVNIQDRPLEGVAGSSSASQDERRSSGPREEAELEAKRIKSEMVLHKRIRIIEILEVTSNPLKTLLREHLNHTNLEKISLRDDFTKPSGIAIVKENDKPAVIMVRIPFLAIHKERESGLKCQEYRTRVLNGVDTGSDYGESDLSFDGGSQVARICQAWAVTINSRLLLVYGGKNYTRNRQQPLVVPYQNRIGSYLSLAHILSKLTCQSDQKVVEHFTSELSNLHIKATKEAMASCFNLEPTITLEEIYKAAAISQAQLTALHGMTLQQMQVLKELTHFFELSIIEERSISRRYAKEWIFVNGVSQCKEHIVPTLASLRETTNNRTVLADKLEGLSGSFRVFLGDLIQRGTSRKVTEEQKATKEEISKGFSTMASSQTTQSEKVQDAIVAQTRQQEAMNDEIFHQGQTISIFTVVSTVFLPLGFFCSYFGMDFVSAETTLQSFWLPTGIVTGTFSVLCIYFVLISRWEMRRFVKWFTDLIVRTGLFFRPASRQDCSTTEIYLRLLPRYQVRLVSTTNPKDILYLTAPATTELTSKVIEGSIWERLPSIFRRPEPLQLKTCTEAEKTKKAATFRYDESKGWLYLQEPEPLYNLMYRAHCSLKPEKDSFFWKPQQMQMDLEPFRFRSRFEKEEIKRSLITEEELKKLGSRPDGDQLKWITPRSRIFRPAWTAAYYPDRDRSGLETIEEFTITDKGLLRATECENNKKYWLYLEEPVVVVTETFVVSMSEENHTESETTVTNQGS